MLRWVIWVGVLASMEVAAAEEVHRVGVDVAPGRAEKDAARLAELRGQFAVARQAKPIQPTAEAAVVLAKALATARNALSLSIPDPNRVVTFVQHGEDVLAAEWPASVGAAGPDQVLPVLLWDDSTSTTIVFQIDKTRVASPRSVQELIESISVWNQVYHAGARLTFRYPSLRGLVFTGSSRRGPLAQFDMADTQYTGVLLNGRAFLIVRRWQHEALGDELKGVKERFPPLRTRLRDKPISNLLSEIGARLEREPQAGTAERDRVIIDELLEREDFTVQEFTELLLCDVGTLYSGMNRPYIIWAAIRRGKVDKFDSVVREYAQWYPRSGVDLMLKQYRGER